MRPLLLLALLAAACTPAASPIPDATISDAGVVLDPNPIVAATCANLNRLGCAFAADPNTCMYSLTNAVATGHTKLAVVQCAASATSPAAAESCGTYFATACGTVP
jgi:hypothetical protein